jgi:TPR repeat protein
MKGSLLMTERVPGMETPAEGGYSAGLEALGRGEYQAAFDAFVPLAESGDAEAQSQLGFMYLLGQGMAQDFILARMWFTLAASATGGQYREAFSLARDLIAERMTEEQIAASQRLAQTRMSGVTTSYQ